MDASFYHSFKDQQKKTGNLRTFEYIDEKKKKSNKNARTDYEIYLLIVHLLSDSDLSHLSYA